MIAQLVALIDGSSILLDKPVLLIGRHPECDVQIESRKVSRRHCCIAQVGDHLVVRDLGSTNGVRINGARVTEGRIKPGDELTIGSHRYRLRLAAPGESANPAPPRPVPPPPPPAAPDDDLLEACDEPVPLEGPADLPVPPALPARPPPAVDESPSPIVPDELELAPSSDARPPTPPDPPPP